MKKELKKLSTSILVKELRRADMKKIMAGSSSCSGSGRATTSHSCDPCGIDKEGDGCCNC